MLSSQLLAVDAKPQDGVRRQHLSHRFWYGLNNELVGGRDDDAEREADCTFHKRRDVVGRLKAAERPDGMKQAPCEREESGHPSEAPDSPEPAQYPVVWPYPEERPELDDLSNRKHRRQLGKS